MAAQTLRELRHDFRGHANALILSAATLPLADNDHERVQVLDDVLRAAESILATLDQLESHPDHHEAPPKSL